MSDRKREAGTIDSVFCGIEDHGIQTVYIYFKYDRGGCQAFGGFHLGHSSEDKVCKDFVREICYLFNVPKLEDIKGKSGFALKCFGGFNETIEGLENEYGQRFTLTSWSKKHHKDIRNPFEIQKEALEGRILSAKRTIEESKEELKTLKKRYTDWDKK